MGDLSQIIVYGELVDPFADPFYGLPGFDGPNAFLPDYGQQSGGSSGPGEPPAPAPNDSSSASAQLAGPSSLLLTKPTKKSVLNAAAAALFSKASNLGRELVAGEQLLQNLLMKDFVPKGGTVVSDFARLLEKPLLRAAETVAPSIPLVADAGALLFAALLTPGNTGPEHTGEIPYEGSKPRSADKPTAPLPYPQGGGQPPDNFAEEETPLSPIEVNAKRYQPEQQPQPDFQPLQTPQNFLLPDSQPSIAPESNPRTRTAPDFPSIPQPAGRGSGGAPPRNPLPFAGPIDAFLAGPDLCSSPKKNGQCRQGYFRETTEGIFQYITWSYRKCPESSKIRSASRQESRTRISSQVRSLSTRAQQLLSRSESLLHRLGGS